MSEQTPPIGDLTLGTVRIAGSDHVIRLLGNDEGWVTVEPAIQFGAPQAAKRLGQVRTRDDAKTLVERVKAEQDWGLITWTIA